MKEKLTHSELVKLAARWLRENRGCSVVLTELVTYNATGEQPDAIGFHSVGGSILVECKTSRSDFLTDVKKPFRVAPETGMGDLRFYLCMPDVLMVADMPEGWGLLYVGERRLVAQCPPRYRPAHKNNEIAMCVSALRRIGPKIVKDACHPKRTNK